MRMNLDHVGSGNFWDVRFLRVPDYCEYELLKQLRAVLRRWGGSQKVDVSVS